ncbi:MAG TPA: acetate/propionate family kinase [Nitrospirae bacterium]|nr:acetate kinase [bacterium BMS3Abin09]GBE41892.1 acetate kinase [bacterium BMS3Bbin09]HDN95337.1 acetate/propionate family kinase [Nitrospirota bacterium]HDZ84001.1 acetate/propionate family kinase [Nitrospirota bacterium]
MKILIINSGSSSVRLAIFNKGAKGLVREGSGHFETDKEAPEDQLRRFINEHGAMIDAAIHRVVHGGPGLTEPCLITEKVENEIERLSELAPLHNPVALQWIRACRVVIGNDIPNIAVFDTAFFASMPEVSRIYALPRELSREHSINRYGFHGIAHRAMLQRFKYLRPDIGNNSRVISIQLGSGSSITAIKDGLPIDTSMGFSPNEGLVMSTRSGDIDSGVITYLQNRAGLSANEIDKMLNTSSGLLGVSGLSSDMKTLLGSEEPDARLAVELYCYRVKKYIGAYIAALGGVDAILFGGGVGENAPRIRKKIIDNMEWCGLLLDDRANEEAVGKEGRISSANSKIDVIVVPVDEAAVMAEEAVGLL